MNGRSFLEGGEGKKREGEEEGVSTEVHISRNEILVLLVSFFFVPTIGI